jgi:maltooligosyltrehalose trehalohydrolase
MKADGRKNPSVPPPARRIPVGAEVDPAGGVHFRLWAPRHTSVAVKLEGGPGTGSTLTLDREAKGYFSKYIPQAAAGTRYRYQTGDGAFPDPASRSQPEGPHGASVVVDPSRFSWTDGDWPGIRLEKQVIYEMHLGTFTREGTWKSASLELEELSNLGVTLLEIMPIAEFPGEFGWGYDGVHLFAPAHVYGTPDDARAFVDRAHALGIGVILDVVYNHLGPDGNYLTAFSETYFTDRHQTDWGAAIDFEGAESEPVRELFVSNAGYWIDEFHFDGLRLDATQSIFDASDTHILADVGRRVREAARHRDTVLIAENEPQLSNLVRPRERGGYGLDGLWNDDFHHAARVALTGRAEAYYSNYSGTAQELVSAVKWGFLYQGQHYPWQKHKRGTPCLDLRPSQFVVFLENHDQVANSATGERLHALTSPGRHRALVALMLLGPATPMLFQGEEFASSAPFLYFADHGKHLAEMVQKGRSAFLSQFPSAATGEVQAVLDAPHARETFERSKLDHTERNRNARTYAMYRELIRLRRTDPVFSLQTHRGVDGAVLGPSAFVLRYFGPENDDRLLIVNMGHDVDTVRGSEPLLAPPSRRRWDVLWLSEDPRYGGSGAPPPEQEGAWRLLGESAVALRAIKRDA